MHCYPLLATEQSLIFDTLHAENPSLYLCQIQIYFTGSLDIVILLNAWRHALQSYEILRSCFIEDNTGLMQQIVHDQVTHSFQLVDFTDFPAKEGREKAYQQLLQQDIEIPFDLKIFPLMRLILCRMSSKTHRLIWTYHPILLDLGSTLRVFNETMQYYAAYYHQRPIPSQIHTTKREILSRLPIVDTRKIEDYWTQYLGNYTGDNTLPFSILKNKYIGKKTKVHAQNFYIEKSHYFNIKAFARKHGLTPSLILHAAWGLTLCTYLNTDDMLFGSVRTLSPSIIKNGAGLFINTLPIRVQFNEKTRVLDCLNSLRSQHRHLKQYWNTALNDIKRWLKLSPNQTLFNTCVSFSTRESNYILQKNFTDAFLQLNIKFNTDTHYPLMLEFLEQGDQLLGRLNYHSYLFPGNIKQLITSLQLFIKYFIEKPHALISQLRLTTQTEHQKLVAWNNTNTSFQWIPFSTLFEQQVNKTSKHNAVIFGAKQLSYSELNTKANQLARWLQQEGIRANIPVAIYMERCLEMPIALLGIIKSGGAYLPIDSRTPIGRLNEILTDSQTPILLTITKFQEQLRSINIPRLKIIYFDQKNRAINSLSTTNLKTTFAPYDDFYIIYTSGSTGKPKGVRNHHIGIMNQLTWMQKTIPLTSQDRILQKTSISFDVSAWEFFWPWLSGAQVIIAAPEIEYDFEKLNKCIERKKITIIQFVPTQLDSFVRYIKEGIHPAIRYILSIGEALKQKTANDCLNIWPTAKLYNLYGPSEAAIAVSFHLCNKKDSYTHVSIGKPIDNMQLFVLNKYQQLLPIGAIGELYIGGIGIANGYLKKPELTAKSFIKNSTKNINNFLPETLYKTGDLAIWSLEDELHFIGRTDHQIKRHGARIELGEIESILLQQKEIQQCTVEIQKKNDTDYLIAYCIANSEFHPTNQHLYNYLSVYLPAYMIPTHFVWLDTLPRLINGKLDRSALPPITTHMETCIEVDLSEPLITSNFDKTTILKNIFQEVLQIKSINLNDNLFFLGGDSISVIQIINKARDKGLYIKPKWIFENPTLASLNKTITAIKKNQHISAHTNVPAPAIQKSLNNQNYNNIQIPFHLKFYSIKDFFPLSNVQRGIFFHSITNKSQPLYLTQLILTLSGKLRISVFREVWKEIMEDIDLLRTAFSYRTDIYNEAIQIVVKKLELPLQLIDLTNKSLAEKEKTLAKYIKNDRETPFHMDVPPLFRISIFVIGNEKYIFTYTCHHIISDGWSLGLLFHAFVERYQNKVSGLQPPKNWLSLPYQDYIDWSRAQIDIEDEARTYWQKLLASFNAPTELTTKNIFRNPSNTLHFLRKKFSLGEKLSYKLRNIAKKNKITLNALVQGAWSILLSRYSHRKTVFFGSVISGRTIDLDHIYSRYGLFSKVIPVAVKLERSDTVIHLCRYLFNQSIESDKHAIYPLAKIQSDIYNGQSLFHHIIAFQNYPLNPSMIEIFEGVKIDNISVYETTHYPLNIFIFPSSSVDIEFVYDKRHFSNTEITQLSLNFHSIFKSIAFDPKQKISQTSLVDKNLQAKLLEYSHHYLEIISPQESLYYLIELQANKFPHKIAIQDNSIALTYQDLINSVTCFISNLKNHGVAPGHIVALIFNHHSDAIIAMLAMLKIGCTYIPISPTSSPEYLEYLIRDSGARFILTNKTTRYFAQEYTYQSGANIIWIDDTWLSNKHQNYTNFPIHSEKHHIAYIMYTSGSTGKPKGVSIKQSSIVSLLLAINDHFDFTKDDNFVASSPYFFDISVVELFLPLIMGGTCIVTQSKDISSSKFSNAIKNITGNLFIQATPSFWASQLELDFIKHPSVKIISTGEALLISLTKRLLEYKEFIWNCYGPTENTIFSMAYTVRKNQRRLIHTDPPIGKPLSNTKSYVLDENLSLVPIHLPGELYIGGAGLMQGYIGESGEALNKEKLIDNPFNPGEKLYKTGDKVCWLPDGNLQFLGRFDDQVKIRGFRMDLNQISSLLETHEFVKKAIVLKQEKSQHDASLIAYLLVDDAILNSEAQRISEAHADAWRVIYDHLYQQGKDNTGLNTAGWSSSYTGRAIDKADMQEWVEHTVQKIASYGPKKIFEVGCGMGLLLFPLAPLCQSYYGTDISSVALSYIRQQLLDKPFHDRVILLDCNATSLHIPENTFFDTVIANSVVQYFPHVYYLKSDLDQYVQATASGGQVFIGDIRSLKHLHHFHASVLLAQSLPTTDINNIKNQVFTRIHQEKELILMPEFFVEYGRQHPRITHVDVQLKKGECDNEMNDYRYDVVLHIEKPVEFQKAISSLSLDWSEEKLSLELLKKYLEQKPTTIQLRNIINARWINANHLIRCFEENSLDLNVATCMEKYPTDGIAISASDLTKLAETAGYETCCTFSDQHNTTCFDAFLRLISQNETPYLGEAVHKTVSKEVDWQVYANHPWHISFYKNIRDTLQQHLANHLPHYMLPSSFIIIDAVPLTPNGKLDKKSLSTYTPVAALSYEVAATEIEIALANIWQDILGITQVGVKDNFFQLGGHSLNLLQVMSAIEKQFKVSFDVVRLFELPTIEALAHEIQENLSENSTNKKDTSSVVILSKTGKKEPLFLFHPIGGTVFCYIPLVESLSIDRPIIGIQDPGISVSDLTFNSLTDLAAYYVTLVKVQQPVGPYYLAGASLGGTLAIEVGNQLIAQGKQVAFTGLLDTWATFTEEFDDRKRLEETLKRQHEYLQARLKTYQIDNSEIWIDLNYQRLQLLLQYKCPVIHQAIHLFKATQIEPEYMDLNEPKNHWGEYSTQPIYVHKVPGNHETMLIEPNVQLLAAKLMDALKEAEKTWSLLMKNADRFRDPSIL